MICRNVILTLPEKFLRQKRRVLIGLTFCLLGSSLHAENKTSAEGIKPLSNPVIPEAQKEDTVTDNPMEFRQLLMTIQNQQKELGRQVENLSRKYSGQISDFSSVNPMTFMVSGQLNRAFNVMNDSKGTDYYPVDNSTSPSRLKFVGARKLDADLSLGTRIELGIAPDISSQVSQTNQSPGTWFDQRWTEISFTTGYGKISLGKGDTASNGTAEVDLSRTDVIQYASIADIAGGMLFRQTLKPYSLTTVKVSDVFQDRDGLSRQSRIRYDTPECHGLTFACSLVTHQRSDAAIFWSANKPGFKTAAAFAVSNPEIDGHDLQYDGSFSVLNPGSGLNLTLSGGLEEREVQTNASNLYAKIGWIAKINEYGDTAFGIDYTKSKNLPMPEDSAHSEGFAVIQFWDCISTEVYFLYRRYVLDRESGLEVGDIPIYSFGVRVKF